MRKKFSSLILATLLICCSVVVLPSCFKSRKSQILPEYESGYFKYSVKTEKDGTQKAYLTGLTESGLEQTELIYPAEIDGITVYGIGYEIEAGIGSDGIGDVSSSSLQKFFFPTYQKEKVSEFSVFFSKCSIFWNKDFGSINALKFNSFSSYTSKKYVYGYNIYETDSNWGAGVDDCYIANVTYLYNYDDSPNSGYYWVDTYGESIITFIPPEPTREGYIFEGWYKESECINAWDFDVDVTGKELPVKNYKADVYAGIYLYAKWHAV